MKQIKLMSYALLGLFLGGCSTNEEVKHKDLQQDYPNILELAYTPTQDTFCSGWFVDQGAWIGFTPPTKEQPVNGFCGPFSLDYRKWLAKSAVVVAGPEEAFFDGSVYYPGKLTLTLATAAGQPIEESLIFADENTALLHIAAPKNMPTLQLTGDAWLEGSTFTKNYNDVVVNHPTGEITVLSFLPDVTIEVSDSNYQATVESNDTYVAISTFANKTGKSAGLEKASTYLSEPETVFNANTTRWNNYLSSFLRDDLNEAYDRIAVKSFVTLMSNWKTSRGGLLHEGMVPSHAVGYFMGFWAWDTWKFAVPLAKVTPELAKNMIRSMFDYQQEDGMIIDCIYADASENNARDSKPPLASWAVDAVFEATNDTAFLKEMYPQLLSYFKWWYEKRDHDKNGLCEFGSTDGTIVAAAWESGMDNAIRFDNAKMLKNGSDAWSFNQESIDLNAFLAYEWQLLNKFAGVLGEEFTMPYHGDKVAEYFFDDETGFYYDRIVKSGEFIKEPGSEGYIPFWTNLASKEQMDKALVLLTDTTMFSTYIPFPTVAADNPKYMSNGYWRGPIWLDQTYFAIKGLRNYGYNELANKYTEQVFDRLDGLKNGAPIHENYDSHTGGRLKAPHFSWSSSHLLLMYQEYQK